MSVMPMLSVKIPVGPITVIVKMDIPEMDAPVGTNNFPVRVFLTYSLYFVGSSGIYILYKI